MLLVCYNLLTSQNAPITYQTVVGFKYTSNGAKKAAEVAQKKK